MNLKLTRTSYDPDGIFGILFDENNQQVAVTLEHSFNSEPKIPLGVYTCKRGQHQLEGMASPFTTFQVMNVPNHTNILIHMGNYNKDSDGCVLVGRGVAPNPDAPSENMITSSLNTFNKLMDLQKDVDQFTLTVE